MEDISPGRRSATKAQSAESCLPWVFGELGASPCCARIGMMVMVKWNLVVCSTPHSINVVSQELQVFEVVGLYTQHIWTYNTYIQLLYITPE